MDTRFIPPDFEGSPRSAQIEFNQNVISSRRQFEPKENFNIDILSAWDYTVYLILMFERQSQKIVNQRKSFIILNRRAAHTYINLFDFENLIIGWE